MYTEQYQIGQTMFLITMNENIRSILDKKTCFNTLFVCIFGYFLK